MIATTTGHTAGTLKRSWPTRLQDRGGVGVVGVAGVALSAAGLSGVGDAPAPNDTAASMAAHFHASSDSVLDAAPVGLLGVLAVAVVLFSFGRRLRRASEPTAATAVTIGGCAIAGYFVLLHVVYTTLAYTTDGIGPDATKALFVLTILATPAFGLAVSVTLGGAAIGARRAGLLPAWWTVVTGVGSLASAVAIVSYADSGYFSPDVQQQVVGNIVLLWLLAASWALTTRKGPSDGT